MMVLLFLLIIIAMVMLFIGWRVPAIVLALFNLLLALHVFITHITIHLQVNL